MGREIVVEEELTTHQVEWEVVSSPGKPEEARRVVQSRTSTCLFKGQLESALEGEVEV